MSHDTPASGGTSSTGGTGSHQAGAFDIRNIIGALLGLYGVILTLAGLLGEHEPAKTGGVNANLWTGLGLLVVAAAFLLWARLRPIIVPEDVDPPDDDPTRPAPKRTRPPAT
ncbi:hypothetical protein [Nocardioides sp. Soil805]|uniref:hypothetical protein n=1 Tax=Nocardioides sp. Soil805 TaxID=1736416 RepID=UPI00070356BA|nr:hypothetical protein [Nocardioides sp. Soil805]KRF35296.1 hypothetical protein ASG94_14440 [Nocardioides sp. Soil805]